MMNGRNCFPFGSHLIYYCYDFVNQNLNSCCCLCKTVIYVNLAESFCCWVLMLKDKISVCYLNLMNQVLNKYQLPRISASLIVTTNFDH